MNKMEMMKMMKMRTVQPLKHNWTASRVLALASHKICQES